MSWRSSMASLIFRLMLLIPAVSLTLAAPAFSAGKNGQRNDAQDFLAAARAYEAGEWERAIRLYEDLMARAGFSASLCYNLGTSYARSGQTGRAILQFERALLLAPGKGEIRYNLQRLRQDKGLTLKEHSLSDQAGAMFTLDQWTLAATVLLAALALFHLVTLRFPASARLSRIFTGTALFLLVLSLAGAAIQYRNQYQAVLISGETPLLISPFAGAGNTGVTKEGSLLRIIKRHDHYALVRDDQGHGGWIPEASFEPIVATMDHFIAQSR